MIMKCMKYLFYDLACLLLVECYMLKHILDWNQTIWHQQHVRIFRNFSSKQSIQKQYVKVIVINGLQGVVKIVMMVKFAVVCYLCILDRQ